MSVEKVISAIQVDLSFPAPIAAASRRYNSCAEEQDPARKLLCLFLLFESVLRYLCYVLSADWLARQGLVGAPPPWLEQLKVNRSLTLGQWRGAFRDLAAAQEPATAFMPEAGLLWQDADTNATLDELVTARNSFLHTSGAVAWSDEEVRQFLGGAKPRLSLLLAQLAFLRDYTVCIAISGSLFDSAPNTDSPAEEEYTLLRCMGAYGESWPRRPYLVPGQKLLTEHPFLVTPDARRLLYLWPFVVDGESDQSHEHELYVFEHQDASGLRHATYSGVRLREEVTRSWNLRAGSFIPQKGDLPARIDLVRPDRILEAVQERKRQLEGIEIGSSRRYFLERRIGEGSMGTVYYARGDVDRRYAVKILHPHLPPALLRRFERGIRSLEILRGHPNILLIIDWGVYCAADGKSNGDAPNSRSGEEFHYCVTEFAEHGDLSAYLQHHCLPTKDAREIPELDSLATRLQFYRQLVAGVAQMHDKHMVHRDLKPSNALLMENGTVRVADMDVVKILDLDSEAIHLTRRGSMVGTLGYMAPEQQMGGGHPCDERVDIFALGIILFQTIFGRLPRQKVAHPTDVLTEQQALSALPKGMRRLILRCTRKQATERYRNAGELGKVLDPVLKDFLTGHVVARTVPPGAQVFVNGEPVAAPEPNSGINAVPSDAAREGETDLVLAAGEHVLTACLDGQEFSTQHRIRVRPQSRLEVVIDARPAPATDQRVQRPHTDLIEHYLSLLDVTLSYRSVGYGLVEDIIDRNSVDVWREMVREYGDALLPALVHRLSTGARLLPDGVLLDRESDPRELQTKIVCLLTHWGEPRAIFAFLDTVQSALVPGAARAVKGKWLEFLAADTATTTPQLLDTLVRETDPALKLSVCSALANIREPDLHPTIQTALAAVLDNEEDSAVRRAAARALDAGEPINRDVLLRTLRADPAGMVRLQCALALGQQTGEHVFLALLDSIRTDTDAETRSAAAVAMLHIDPARARAALREIIEEQDPVLVTSLRDALQQTDEAELLTYLQQVQARQT